MLSVWMEGPSHFLIDINSVRRMRRFMEWRKMERNNKHTDEAVSPVIGVILMVAITVILAAVIAAYVYGLVGTMNTTKMVAISVTQINNSAISVVTLGGQDLK